MSGPVRLCDGRGHGETGQKPLYRLRPPLNPSEGAPLGIIPDSQNLGRRKATLPNPHRGTRSPGRVRIDWDRRPNQLSDPAGIQSGKPCRLDGCLLTVPTLASVHNTTVHAVASFCFFSSCYLLETRRRLSDASFSTDRQYFGAVISESSMLARFLDFRRQVRKVLAEGQLVARWFPHSVFCGEEKEKAASSHDRCDVPGA